MTGCLGEDLRVFSTGFLEGGVVIELGHATAVGPVTGIAPPVVGLGRRETASLLETICLCHQFLVVLRLVGGLHELFSPRTLLLAGRVAAGGKN